MTARLMSSGDSVLQFFTVLLVFIFVLGITYFTTRWIANYQKKQNKGKNIEVIESSRIGQNKFIQIVKTGDKYVVIGIGKNEITMLTELDSDMIKLPEDGETEGLDFKAAFEKAKNLMKK